MSYDWGPNFIVPSETLKKFSGTVRLREMLDEDLLKQELKELELSGPVLRITNPWYYRKKGTSTWIKIGESEDKSENFAVQWDTRKLANGRYEVLGLMHVFVNRSGMEYAIARQSMVEVSVKN
ncbi:MAG: hypothetical protein Q7T57_01965 [Dehalococcoidales bacterium]|nr:hypothetical protein [Dehalococcoidales bacterium]